MTSSGTNAVYPVPKGWRLCTAGDIRSPERNSCVAGPFGSKISSKYFVDDGVPVIRGSNLRDNLTRFVPNGFVFVSEARAQEYVPQHVRGDDLVFTCWGTIGQVGLVPDDGPYSEYIISNKQLKLRVDRAIAEPRFCFYYFASPRYAEYIRNRGIGGAVPGINLGILKSLLIALPPINVQRRIADILSAYDDLIENNRRRMALLEEAARQLYREWFVRLRFPGHEHTRITNGLPEGWERRRLSDVAEVNRESLSGGYDGEIEYIDISSVTPGSINETTHYDFRDAPSRARRVVQHGDIIWSCVRPNRRSYAAIWQPVPNLIASTGFAVVTPVAVPTAFLLQAMTTDAFVGYLENHARGAAYPAVVAGDFERAEVIIPRLALVRAFNEQAEPLLSQAHTLRLQNVRLRAARDLLLPRLMCGEITV
jgi:type I restriction enzyme S subunit